MLNLSDVMARARKRVGHLIDPYSDRMAEAVTNRSALQKTPIGDIVGSYDVGDVRMVITDDPVEVLTKSATRPWAAQSCERLKPGEDCEDGPFSDIENDTGVVYYFHRDADEPFARALVRWCETSDGQKDVGIEPKIYPLPTDSMGRRRVFDGRPLIDALTNVVESKGYGKYAKCTTPYVYTGWSHMANGLNRRIEYRPWWRSESDRRKLNP